MRENFVKQNKKHNHRNQEMSAADDVKEELINICQLIEYFNRSPQIGFGAQIEKIPYEKEHAPKLHQSSAMKVHKLARDMSSTNHPDKNHVGEQVPLLMQHMNQIEEEALYSHSLGISVSKWFLFSIMEPRHRFNIHMENARAARKFFCSDEMIDIGAGHDLVKKSFVDASKVVGGNSQLAFAELMDFELDVAVAKNKKEEEKKKNAAEREGFVKQLSKWNKILGIKTKNGFQEKDEGGPSITKRRKKDL